MQALFERLFAGIYAAQIESCHSIPSAKGAPMHFSNPAVAFVLAWSLVLSLCSMRWVPAFDPLYSGAMQLSALIIVSYLAGYAAFSLIAPRQKLPPVRQPAEDFIPNTWLRLIFLAWVAVSAYEISASGGLPLLWLSDGSGRTYDMFGIRGLHGFMNALWMFLSFSYLINLVRKPSFEKLVIFALLVLWVFLVISRALMLLAFVQSAAYVLSSSNIRFRVAIPSMLVGLVVVGLSFGFLGDARLPTYDIYSSVGLSEAPRAETAEDLPAPTRSNGPVMAMATWGYVYLVSPVVTLALNVSETPPEYSLIPHRAVGLFLPTVAKRLLGMDQSFEGDFGVLAHNAFNVSTAFREFYAHWGIAGIIIFAIGLGAASAAVWRLRRDPKYLPFICAFSMCAAYTVFNNQFFQPMILTYLFLLLSFPRLADLWAEKRGQPLRL